MPKMRKEPEQIDNSAGTEEIIVIKQLPVIEQRLKIISDAAQDKVCSALSLACTEDTYKDVKKVRADLRKDFESLEEQRKSVDRQIKERMAPFYDAYKKYINDVYGPADAALKQKITEVEDGIKSEKTRAVKAYFDEYAKSKNIDFISFEDAGIAVTMSVSAQKLQDSAKSFIDRVCEDMALIETQDCKAEIMVEYRKTMNVSQAITQVSARLAAIEAEKKRAAKAEEIHKQEQAVVQRVEEHLPPPVVVDEQQPEKFFKVGFTVYGTKQQLKTLKEFLIEGGYKYE